MDLPPDYAFRAPTPDDLDAVAGLRAHTDAWAVVHRGGAVVGYAQATCEEPTVVDSWGVVHPGHHAVIQAAFADYWDHRPEPFDRRRRNRPGTRATTRRSGCWPRRQEHRWAPSPPTSRATTAGWTISPSWRRPGARGRAGLLLHSFAMFARRGLRRVLLSVDAENPTGATKFYERVGMRVVNRWDVWER
jgi:hypothetical protein